MFSVLIVICAVFVDSFANGRLLSGRPVEECPNVKKADIVVLLDESASVTVEGWQKQLQFLGKIMESLPVGPAEVQVGLLKFSTKSKKEFDLKAHMTSAALQMAIKSLKYEQQGVTYTHKALEMAAGMFSRALGGRPKTEKVVMVLTDGASNKPNETIAAAQALHKNNIRVLVVGVGNTREEELQKMASEPKFVLHTSEMNDLVKDDFFNKKVIDSLKCITKCKKIQKADVVFMIDTSQSIQREGFLKEKEFLDKLISGLQVNRDSVHIGLIAFSDNSRAEIKLNPFVSSLEAKDIVKKLTWKWGRTQTHKGLKMAREEYFSRPGGMRSGVPHVLIILTDGRSTEPTLTLEEAKAVKENGSLIIAIGVGDKIDRNELEIMASEKRYVIYAKDFHDLASFKFIQNEVMGSLDCVVSFE